MSDLSPVDAQHVDAPAAGSRIRFASYRTSAIRKLHVCRGRRATFARHQRLCGEADDLSSAPAEDLVTIVEDAEYPHVDDDALPAQPRWRVESRVQTTPLVLDHADEEDEDGEEKDASSKHTKQPPTLLNLLLELKQAGALCGVWIDPMLIIDD